MCQNTQTVIFQQFNNKHIFYECQEIRQSCKRIRQSTIIIQINNSIFYSYFTNFKTHLHHKERLYSLMYQSYQKNKKTEQKEGLPVLNKVHLLFKTTYKKQTL